MSRIWQLRSLERVLTRETAANSERLYERFNIESNILFQVQIRNEWHRVDNIAYGGMAFTAPQSERNKLLPGQRVDGLLKIWGDECAFTARVVGLREDGERIVVATQFMFDSIVLMDFLRAHLPYMRLGFFLASQPSEQLNDGIEFDLTGLDRIDFDAELAVNRTSTGVAASVVFAYGNAQIALAYNRSGFTTYKNLSFGGEMAPFAKTASLDHAIFRKGTLLFAGFLSLFEGDADVRWVFDKAVEELAKVQSPTQHFKRSS